MVLGGADGRVLEWRPEAAAELAALEGAVTALAVHPGGEILGAGTEHGEVYLVRPPRDLQLLERPEEAGPVDAVRAVRFSPDGRRVAAALGPRGAASWRTRDGAALARIQPPERPGKAFSTAYSLAFGPGGEVLATGWDSDLVLISSAETGEERAVLDGRGGALLGRVSGVLFSDGGRRLLAASSEVRVWDCSRGTVLLAIDPPGEQVTHLAFARGGEDLALATDGGLLQLLRVR